MLSLLSAYLAPAMAAVGLLLLPSRWWMKKRYGATLSPAQDGKAFFYKSLGFWLVAIGAGMMLMKG
jgi:hypothetical protein